MPEFRATGGKAGVLGVDDTLCPIQRRGSRGIVELLLHVHGGLNQHHTAGLAEESCISAVYGQPTQLVGYADRGEFIVAGMEIFLHVWSKILCTRGGTVATHRSQFAAHTVLVPAFLIERAAEFLREVTIRA